MTIAELLKRPGQVFRLTYGPDRRLYWHKEQWKVSEHQRGKRGNIALYVGPDEEEAVAALLGSERSL